MPKISSMILDERRLDAIRFARILSTSMVEDYSREIGLVSIVWFQREIQRRSRISSERLESNVSRLSCSDWRSRFESHADVPVLRNGRVTSAKKVHVDKPRESLERCLLVWNRSFSGECEHECSDTDLSRFVYWPDATNSSTKYCWSVMWN